MFVVVLPINSADKRSLSQLKKRLVGQSYSDQLVVLKIFRVSSLPRVNYVVILHVLHRYSRIKSVIDNLISGHFLSFLIG